MSNKQWIRPMSNHDDYMTPKHAWEAIKDYIPRDKVIWEAFYGDGKSGKYLEELGFSVGKMCSEAEHFDEEGDHSNRR